MTRDSTNSRETVTMWVTVVSSILVVLFTLVPVIVIAIIGAAQGTVPSSEEGGFFGYAEGYPAFNPQNWLLLIPALGMLFLAFYTLPMRERSFLSGNRALLFIVSTTAAGLAATFGSAFIGAPGVGAGGFIAAMVFAFAALLFALRGLLGWLRLVPKSWRPAQQEEGRRFTRSELSSTRAAVRQFQADEAAAKAQAKADAKSNR